MHHTVRVSGDFRGKNILEHRVYTGFRGNSIQMQRVPYDFKDD
jgi:hypothetical protein